MKKVVARGSNLKYILRKYLGVFNHVLKICIFLAILFGIYYFSFKTDFFNITEINISGAKVFVSEQDLKNLAISNSLEKNLLTYKISYLADILTKSFLGAKKINVSKSFPN